MGCPHYRSISWCDECDRDERLGLTPHFQLDEAFRRKAGRAMHDLLVWLWTGGLTSEMDWGLAMFIEGMRDQ